MADGFAPKRTDTDATMYC